MPIKAHEPDCTCNDCLEARSREAQLEREGHGVASTITNFLNGRNARYIVSGMAQQHRTLQQAFTGLCVAWLEHCASLKPGQFDGRNQASVEFAKKLTATEAWQNKYLPYI